MFKICCDHMAKPKKRLSGILNIGNPIELPHGAAALARSAAALALRGHDGMTSGSTG
jgi:hypothetical protein